MPVEQELLEKWDLSTSQGGLFVGPHEGRMADVLSLCSVLRGLSEIPFPTMAISQEGASLESLI